MRVSKQIKDDFIGEGVMSNHLAEELRSSKIGAALLRHFREYPDLLRRETGPVLIIDNTRPRAEDL
jgi:hypothetical protein